MDYTAAEAIVYSTLQIKTLDANKKHLSSATGFQFAFHRTKNSFFPALVTNRHVLENCAFVSLDFTLSNGHGPDIGNTVTAIIDASTRIFHPDPNVDLAILPLADAINYFKDSGKIVFGAYLGINAIPTPEQWKRFDAIEQVVTAGYPKGLRDDVNNLPVTRSGITATPLVFDFLGKSDFLVDMPCFEGGSGSPILLVSNTIPARQTDPYCILGNSIVFLVGIQARSYRFTIKSDIHYDSEEAQGKDATAVVEMPMNLGICIKSTQLLAFESILSGSAE